MQKQVILCQRAASNVLHVIIVAVLILYLSPHLLLSQGLGTIYGVVRDAVTGKPVTGATVRIAGRTVVTNQQGKYTIRDIPATFRVGLSKDTFFRRTGVFPLSVSLIPITLYEGAGGFLECTGANYLKYETADVVIRPCERTEHNVSLSTDLEESSLRFILTWGSIPKDLDIYLSVPAINMMAPTIVSSLGSKSFVYAWVDRDTRDGFGPETLTIQRLFQGTYRLSIGNASDRDTIDRVNGKGPLANCGAKIAVYNAKGLVQTIQVPSEGKGIWWNVCTIDGATGRINVINTISNQQTVATVVAQNVVEGFPVSNKKGETSSLHAPLATTYEWDFGNGLRKFDFREDRTTFTTSAITSVTVRAIAIGRGVMSSYTRPLYISNIWLSHSQPFISYLGEFLGISDEQEARLWSERIANYSAFQEPVWYGTVTDTLAKVYLNVAVPDSNTSVRISIPDRRLGTLTSLYPDIRSGTQATVRGVSSQRQPQFWTVCMMYTPPMTLPPEASGRNEITVPVQVTIGTNATQIYPIRLVRTPVIAVPDVFSDAADWEKSGISAELERQGFRLFYADYAGEKTSAFSPLAVPSSVGVSAFTRATVEAKNFYLEQGIYVPRVDVIGHGMGGIFARSFLQNEVRRFFTLWGSVRRFITLGTPHGGSPLGTYLWSRREGRATATQSNAEVMTGLGFPLGAAYRSLGRGDSSLSLLRPMPETATHTIVSDWKPEATSALTNTNAFLRLLQTPDEYRTNTTPLDSIFQGRAHNMYADLASQRGGLAANNPAVTTFSGIAHGNMPFAGLSETLLSSPRVWRRITELLTTTASTSFVNGLPASPEAWWNTAPNFMVRPAAIPAGSLRITQPTRGQILLVDTLSSFTVRVEINGTAQVRDAVAMIEDVGMIPLSPSGTSSLTGTLTNLGNTRSIGRKRVTVIARDGQTGGQLVDTTSVMLQPRGELEDITVRPCFLTMEAGKTTGQQQMRVQALYGGIWYDVTGRQQGTVYTSTQAAVRVNSEGFVTAFGMTASTGSSQIVTVEHGGLQVRIPVQVSGILTSVRESAQRPSLGESHTSFHLDVSPQPASNEITLRYILDYDTDVRFDVYDIRGQHCGGIEYGRQQRGQHTVLLSTHTLAQGTYLVRCTLSGSCCGQGIAPRLGAALVNIVK